MVDKDRKFSEPRGRFISAGTPSLQTGSPFRDMRTDAIFFMDQIEL